MAFKFNLENVSKLKLDLLTLCSGCKKVEIEGQWYSEWENPKAYDFLMDNYFHHPGKAKVTHTVCPSCLKEHYPELMKKDKINHS